MAVATSASAMPGATIASVACCTLPSELKALMMPQTVPNRPTYGTDRADRRQRREVVLEPLDLLQLRDAHRAARALQQQVGADAALLCAAARTRGSRTRRCSPCRWRCRATRSRGTARQVAARPEAVLEALGVARARRTTMRLLKMIAQDISEAAAACRSRSAPPGLACTISFSDRQITAHHALSCSRLDQLAQSTRGRRRGRRRCALLHAQATRTLALASSSPCRAAPDAPAA